MTTRNWGFALDDRDTKVRAQDDFYRYAAGTWLKNNPIPETESRWGSFTILRKETDMRLRKILQELEGMKRVAPGSPEQMIRDYFRSGMDMQHRNKLGSKPIAPLLKRIGNAKDARALMRLIPELHTLGIGVFFNMGVDQDSKKSTRYILHLVQDGLGMPEREYYLKQDAESKRVRNAYLAHVTGTFRLLGYAPKAAANAMQQVLALETMLAKASMTKEDVRDPHKTYHKKTVAQLSRLAPAIDWPYYLTKTKSAKTPNLIVMQPLFLQEVSRILTTAPLQDLKEYCIFHVANDYASLLSAPFVRHQFAFYGKTLTGMKAMRPLWRRVLGGVNSSLGEALGQIYIRRHFTPEAKKRMNELVDDLFVVYEERLKKLDWMGPATKKKALRKLKAMNRKIGYPDKWKSYKGLSIQPDDYVGNAMHAAAFHHSREMRKLGRPLDRGEWFMSPQTVNAYFAGSLNDIVFPAAILQPPFFDLTADDAVNYGSIGTVIGHEITHGFDDKGSQFDHNGDLKSWWTVEDRKRFEKHADVIRKQYSGYAVADGVHVNGELTLGENIADLGGIAIAYDAYQRRLEKTGRRDIDGLSPEQRFFLAITLFDRENARPEFEKMQVLTDPHSPSEFRINGPLANINAFYQAYGVKKGDKLYREPKVRTTVW